MTAFEITPYTFRILQRVERYSRLGYGQDMKTYYMRNAYDQLEQEGLIRCEKDYVLTETGKGTLDRLTADGAFERRNRQEDEIRSFLGLDAGYGFKHAEGLRFEYVPSEGRRWDGYRPQAKVLVHYDPGVFDQVLATLGRQRLYFHGIGNVLVFADRVRLLPSGDVLHELEGLAIRYRGTRTPTHRKVYAIKCLVDDVWVTAPTERGVKMRFRRYEPKIKELPDVPEEPRTEQDDIDDEAIGAELL